VRQHKLRQVGWVSSTSEGGGVRQCSPGGWVRVSRMQSEGQHNLGGASINRASGKCGQTGR
jgi:hypothetical protein